MEARETSGATTALLLRYVREHGGDDAVSEVLRLSGVPHAPAELEDLSRWVSHDTRLRLFDAAAEVTGDPQVMRRVGQAALEHGVNHSLVLVLRALGSPRHVYRQLPRFVAKYSTTNVMETLHVGPTSATVRYRALDEHLPSRRDCDFSQGLISVIPRLFGLPVARVLHPTCQADGHTWCTYEVHWQRSSRLPWRRPRGGGEDKQLVALRGQLEALQSAASDLVDSDSLDAVLERITERAASAVVAPAYLLAVHSTRDDEPLVRSAGLSPEREAELLPALLRGEDLGPQAVVVDVVSARRHHGWLAALYEGQARGGDEHPLLAAYARHAAAALDLLTALEDSRRDERRASVLLGLAHQLAGTEDTREVAELVSAALPAITGAPRNTVMLWDPSRGELRVLAATGQPDAEHQVLMRATIRASETPELVQLLGRREPMVLSELTASEPLQAIFRDVGVSEVGVVPLVSGDHLLGVVTTSWPAGRPAADVEETVARLQGVGDLAATALRNAQLLGTVRHQSVHDALTGLPNRVLFTERLDAALRVCDEDEGVAVLFCDLDRFKQVNDVLGHAAGDELLRQVSARLRGAVRPSDTVGRLSGDEFAVLLTGVTDSDLAADLARRIVGCFTEPFRLEGKENRVTASVGVAVHHGRDGRGDRLLRAADGAMYEAKQRGRNQIAVAGAQKQQGAARPSLEAELSLAVERGELRLFFQPVVRVPLDPQTGVPAQAPVVVGAEALIRWQHPRLGLIGPAAFLPLAEESGLVVDVDLWTIGQACRALATWQQPHEAPLHVAVNLAAATLLDPRLPQTIHTALTGSGIQPQQLHLEVVESRSLANLPAVIEHLVELRQLGVRVSLDDFGTGYSTLAWLKQLPVDQIKIDRSFVMDVPQDAAALAVVKGVLALASELGLEVVAEGVEESSQLDALRDAGCHLVQGYLFGRPEPDVPAMVQQHTPRP
ncbi:EAL domain-containing protein [Thalassiella azotivora]